MGRVCVAYACALLLICPLALSRHDDDFAFDNSDEVQVDLKEIPSDTAKNGLKRLWGVPDTSAYVGHLFRMEIPKEAFSGDVVAYKVRPENSRRLPSWLAVDSKHGLISGLPQEHNVGVHTFTVIAQGRAPGLTATDSFSIEVKKASEKPHSKYGSCMANERRMVLTLLIDSPYDNIPPRQRMRALMDLANFMALDGDEFWMEPYKSNGAKSYIVMSSASAITEKRKSLTAIRFNVGCAEKVWPRHKVLISGVREQARDGTLAHTLRLPVLGWKLEAVSPPTRPKRQSPSYAGSGDDYNYGDDDGDGADIDDYSGYGEEGDDSENADTEVNKVRITPFQSSAASNVNFSHVPVDTSRRLGSFSPVVIVPEEDPTTTNEPETQTVIIRASNELPVMTSSSQPPTSASPPSSSEETVAVVPVTSPEPSTSPSTTPTPSTIPTLPSSFATSPTTTPTTPTTVPPTTLPTTPVTETTIEEVTEQDYVSSTERTSTIIGRTTETVVIAMPVNQPPTLKHHMKKLAITAGKAFRYIIPADLFTDPEDGSDLTFTMYEAENVKLNKNSWIQFIPSEREVYGLPLESHVSRWNFIVEARDSEGLAARGPLDITVQQHKGARTNNHQFILELKLNKPFANAIDWQIRALEGIVNLFRDTDMEQLTVLNASQKGDLFEFVWTNDTLPKDSTCPIEGITRVMSIMEAEPDSGTPSPGLSSAMSPELIVVRVRWTGLGGCTRSAQPTPAPDTFPPVPRNQVDLLTASVGHLLVHKVPEDTFFDPEDGGTRNLALSLRYSDRSELPSGHWLQFDAKNQEFYGLPGPGDMGSVNYQLIAEDSSKKSAYDSLVVEVVKAPAIKPTAEFRMTLDYPFPELAYNANNKRKVVEKLAALFGQTDTSNIRIASITDNPTTIIWYNTSLPMDRCPKREIEELQHVISADDSDSDETALKDIVDYVFDKDLKVMSITIIPLGLCAEQNTKTPKAKPPLFTDRSDMSSGSETESQGSYYTEYLITCLVPVIVIIIMVLIAGIIAYALWRRRRSGKMSVGDEEERQAFRSKGIPVIFQDELEERGDTEPVHKSPVIMREEKPPLLPPAPEYRGEEPPYRPPPPFAASRTPPRPKATPTYRKPPPYVPP